MSAVDLDRLEGVASPEVLAALRELQAEFKAVSARVESQLARLEAAEH